VTQSPSATEISAIVLAAGLSSRLGRNKLLLSLGGKPVVHWVLDALLEVKPAQLIVVLGHESRQVRQSCEPYGDSIKYVDNLSYLAGRSTSIHAGLEAVETPVQGVLIAPGDVPFIGGKLLPLLLAAFFTTKRITFPAVNGRKGHPVIFPLSSFPLLRGLSGDETLHDYFKQHPEVTAAMPWQDEGCLLDIDAESDIRQAESYCANLDLRLNPGSME